MPIARFVCFFKTLGLDSVITVHFLKIQSRLIVYIALFSLNSAKQSFEADEKSYSSNQGYHNNHIVQIHGVHFDFFFTCIRQKFTTDNALCNITNTI